MGFSKGFSVIVTVRGLLIFGKGYIFALAHLIFLGGPRYPSVTIYLFYLFVVLPLKGILILICIDPFVLFFAIVKPWPFLLLIFLLTTAPQIFLLLQL